MRDGTPLKNSKGIITSHIVGLFSRVTNLLEKQLKLVFVFDGEMPELKAKERERRKGLKQEAAKKLEAAQAAEDVDAMKKYAGRTAKLTPEMVKQSQDVLDALGIPWVQAPSEAEAQAAHMVRKGDAQAVASQDYDSLLFGAPRMIKNLSISGKRKKPGTSTYYSVDPEKIQLQKVLSDLEVNQKQLIALGMLVGTDFNPGGVKGLGPKKGLKLVHKHKDDLQALFAEAEWESHFDIAWEDVYATIADMPVTDEYTIEFKSPDEKRCKELLCDKFELSETRVQNALESLIKSQEQKGLSEFF